MAVKWRRLTAAETLLDRIEIGRIGWQKDEDTTVAFHDLAKGICLVNGTIVEDQDAFVLRVGIHFGELHRQHLNGYQETAKQKDVPRRE